jgi:hypothetical protein
VAVSVTGPLAAPAAALAVKLALSAPAGTLTEDGTTTALLLLDRVTAVPPELVCGIPTVQAIEPPGATLAGLHCNEVTGTYRLNLSDSVVPFEVAVRVAV